MEILRAIYCFSFVLVSAIETGADWQPIAQPELLSGIKELPVVHPTAAGYVSLGFSQAPLEGNNDKCELYKVGFLQDLYFQYIQYKTHVPEMKEFTLCYWSKFFNHSNDHPVFSYAVDGQPKAILAWISNTERSSYFSMSVEGHTFYRLNYPLRLNKWYHTCQSWNGKTGEWQIWVNAERVGRGFHNRLVGHSIPSGGVAITGQQQSQVGGGFLEGTEAPKGSGGMLGELTMLQLYNVALTAGKAHRDHKHHHAHQFDHNGNQITTPAPTSRTPTRLPTHPLLTGGQLNPALMLNFAGAQPTQQAPQPQVIQGQNYNAQLVNGQFVGSLVSQQLLQGRSPQQPVQLQLIPVGNSGPTAAPLTNSRVVSSSFANPANVQFIDTPLETHQLFKRENEGLKITKKAKRQTAATENKHQKRELYISGGTIIDDGLQPATSSFDQDFLNGLAGIGENKPILRAQKQNDEREPAEAEVKAVMNVCSGCDQEPFGKALVFSWRTVPKKLYSGAFFSPAVPQCKLF